MLTGSDYVNVDGVELLLNYGNEYALAAAVGDGAACRDWARVFRQAAAKLERAEAKCRGGDATTYTHVAARVQNGVLRVLVMIE